MNESRVVRRGSWVAGAFALLALLPTGPLAAQERTIPLRADGDLRIFNPAGSIRVVGWDKDSVRWVGELAAGQELFGGGSGRSAKLGVGGAEGSARLTVQVPRGARILVDARESSVEVEGVTGPIEISGGDGAVRVTGAPVRLTIQTVDGSVDLIGGPFRSTEVRSAGGAIHAAGLQGELDLSAVTGVIVADAVGVTRGRIGNVSGVVRLTADLDHTGTLTIESHGGDVTLGLDPARGFELVATAFGGRIENEVTRSVARPVPKGRGVQLQTIGGDVGGTVTVTSFKGNIRIVRR